MTRPITVESTIHFVQRGRGAPKRIRPGELPALEASQLGRVPRIARFMALAIRFDGLVRSGAVADYAELARLGHVTRARITQIMNLLLLPPDLQEALLFLPYVERGDDPFYLGQLQPLALTPDWRKQRRLWRALISSQVVT